MSPNRAPPFAYLRRKFTMSAVKSAVRVLQILEHFDEVQAPLGALEVSKALKLPQSSTWALLQTLLSVGYLTLDSESRTYLPTERVSLLGAWAYAPLFGEGRLLDLMKDLRATTRARIVLAAQAGHLVRYIHVLESVPHSAYQQRGAPLPLLKTAIGRLFLSLYAPEDAARIIRRLNAERTEGESPANVGETLKELNEIRRLGYSVSIGRKTPGSGTVAMLIPRVCGRGRPLALGITQDDKVVTKGHANLAKRMRRAIRQHLGDLVSAVDCSAPVSHRRVKRSDG